MGVFNYSRLTQISTTHNTHFRVISFSDIVVMRSFVAQEGKNKVFDSTGYATFMLQCMLQFQERHDIIWDEAEDSSRMTKGWS